MKKTFSLRHFSFSFNLLQKDVTSVGEDDLLSDLLKEVEVWTRDVVWFKHIYIVVLYWTYLCACFINACLFVSCSSSLTLCLPSVCKTVFVFISQSTQDQLRWRCQRARVKYQGFTNYCFFVVVFSVVISQTPVPWYSIFVQLTDLMCNFPAEPQHHILQVVIHQDGFRWERCSNCL